MRQAGLNLEEINDSIDRIASLQYTVCSRYFNVEL
jgi:hypothetical protein